MPFKTLATNLRGFNQNARNGNAYSVLNTELRFPLFRYFSRRPISNQLINHFQVVPFVDVGTAWNGLDPTSERNRYNRREIEQGPLHIELLTPRDPLLIGFGSGLRTSLLGYFIRWDVAWGYEEGVVSPRSYHFSLGLDF